MTITVANRRDSTPGPHPNPTRFYIGRPSPLGNPFRIGRHGSREAVIAQYADWLDWKLTPDNAGMPSATLFAELVAVARRGDLTLICWCAPLACHGDVIKSRIEAVLAGEAEVQP
jgi:hypothetical protein